MGEYVNSKQIQFSKSFVSCGVLEAHHLPKSASQNAFSVANALYHRANPRPSAFVVFSDTDESGRGKSLAGELEKISAGNLTVFGPAVNPKTGNVIRLWVLEVNHENFRKWYVEEAANRVSES